MTVNKLEYFLENGYIHHWLVAGPQAIPILKQDTQAGGINANIVVQPDSDQQFIFTDEPVERAYLDLRGDRLRWIYRNCHVADHLVDVSFTSLQESRQCVWLYTRIKPNQKWETTFEFSTHHGVEVWLNGILLISQPDPIGVDRQIWLTSGVLENRENDLLIRLTWVGAGEGFVDLSCRLVNFPESVSDKDVTILIPTLAHRPARYQRLERLLEYAYLEQVVNHRGNGINLRWAEDLEERVKYCYQIQDKEENIYVEGDWDADPTTALDIGHPTRLFERQFWVVLKALGMEYFDQDLRYQKSFPIYVLDNAYSAVPYGTFYERNREALEDARKYTGSLFAEIAKMELGRWSDVNQEVIRNTTVKINRNEYGHLTDLVGTIGLYHRYKKEKSTPKEVVNLIRECVLRYPFTFMAQGESTDNRPEYEQILAYTAQYLAGQLFPKKFFLSEIYLEEYCATRPRISY